MLLNDSKIVTISPHQLPYAFSKGWINLSLYIHTFCGNVPNYIFPTADQLQLNCSNLWNEMDMFSLCISNRYICGFLLEHNLFLQFCHSKVEI